MNPTKRQTRDRSRWLYLIGGLLLVVAFYLTTRSRKGEESESSEPDGEDT